MKVTKFFQFLVAALMVPVVGVSFAATLQVQEGGPATPPAPATVSPPAEAAQVAKAQEPVNELPKPTTPAPAIELPQSESELVGADYRAQFGAMEDGRQDAEERQHMVRLDAEGRFGGTVRVFNASKELVPSAGLRVKLVSEGKTLAVRETSESGEFTFEGVVPGIYSLVANSPNAHLAYAFYAAPHSEGLDAGIDKIDTVAVAPPNVDEALRLIRFNLPNFDFLPQEQSNANYFEKASRQTFFGSALKGNVDVFDVQKRTSGKALPAATTISQHTIETTGGVLNGRVSQIFGQVVDFKAMKAYLISNGTEIRQVPLNADGTFTINEISPDVYAFVVAGSGGYAAISIQTVEAPKQANLPNGIHFVSIRKAAANLPLSVAIIPPGDLEEMNDNEEGEESSEAPPGANAPSGGSGGGGGGGGGGSGFGAALGAGALGAGIAAGTSGGNGNGFASPFIPGSGQ